MTTATTATRTPTEVMRERKIKRNDYAGNKAFQRWLKTARPVTLSFATGKTVLWEMLDEIASFDLTIGVKSYLDNYSHLISGVAQVVVKGWIKEWCFTRRVKVPYLAYLQSLLSEAGIQYVNADEYKAQQSKV